MTGRALSVAPVTEQVAQTVDSEFRDAAGVKVGTQSTVVGYTTVTTGYQLKLGEAPVDERDFYHLAGDTRSEDVIANARARGKLKNRIGNAVGLASLAAAIAIPIIAGRGAAPYAVGQVFVVAPIGFGVAVWGKRQVERYNFPASHPFGAIQQATPGWATSLDAR
ncbi:MAG: hypothetical protein HOV81_34510 [Kofleriaceae bacterium]|nr:hypothetical protein [Kofleriaceae bacterium]